MNRIELKRLTHENFINIKSYFDEKSESLFKNANKILIDALNELYQTDYKTRLSAAFRRGDLFDKIKI